MEPTGKRGGGRVRQAVPVVVPIYEFDLVVRCGLQSYGMAEGCYQVCDPEGARKRQEMSLLPWEGHHIGLMISPCSGFGSCFVCLEALECL